MKRVFRFLEANHSWNEAFQSLEYRRWLFHCCSSKERLRYLLHHTAHTQRMPRLDKQARFSKELEAYATGSDSTLDGFIAHLDNSRREEGQWNRLFHALLTKDGWGMKTSALFVKAAIQIHRGRKRLHFWSNAGCATELSHEDRIYLPVDAVIMRVFELLGLEGPDFWKINNALHTAGYSSEQMLLWDDLWFWGFFTQKGNGRFRELEWNSEKFWSQLSSPLAHEAEVKKLAEKFIVILKQ